MDREEVGGGVDVAPGGKSAVKDVEETLLNGEGRVRAVVRMRDLMAWLSKEGREDDLKGMQEYWARYGVKEE